MVKSNTSELIWKHTIRWLHCLAGYQLQYHDKHQGAGKDKTDVLFSYFSKLSLEVPNASNCFFLRNPRFIKHFLNEQKCIALAQVQRPTTKILPQQLS